MVWLMLMPNPYTSIDCFYSAEWGSTQNSSSLIGDGRTKSVIAVRGTPLGRLLLTGMHNVPRRMEWHTDIHQRWQNRPLQVACYKLAFFRVSVLSFALPVSSAFLTIIRISWAGTGQTDCSLLAACAFPIKICALKPSMAGRMSDLRTWPTMTMMAGHPRNKRHDWLASGRGACILSVAKNRPNNDWSEIENLQSFYSPTRVSLY